MTSFNTRNDIADLIIRQFIHVIVACKYHLHPPTRLKYVLKDYNCGDNHFLELCVLEDIETFLTLISSFFFENLNYFEIY